MSKSELIEKETILQIVLNNIPAFVFWKDRESVYQGCNQNFATSAGFKSAKEIIGKTDYNLPWTRKESDFFREVDKKVMDSKVAKINFEEPQTIDGGATRWIRTSKIPLFNSSGIVIGILGTYEDITERKEMELKLIENNKELKELNTQLQLINIELEQFAFATSHDLKEPVRMIGSFVGLLEKKFETTLDKSAIEYINYIKDGAYRMNTLINQILTISKVTKAEDQFAVTDINALLNEVITDIKFTIEEKNAKVENNLSSHMVNCNPQKLKLLFQNLILNGIKFNTSEVPKIQIDFEDKPEEWYYSITDNGIGIDSQYISLVFQPFKRLETKSKFPGNGLGLSICDRVVRVHKGKIHLESEVGSGTTFYFTIPK